MFHFLVTYGPFLGYALSSASFAAALVITIDDPVLPSYWPDAEEQ